MHCRVKRHLETKNRENTNSILFRIRQFRHSPHTGSFSQRRWTLPVIRIRENSFHKRGNTGLDQILLGDVCRTLSGKIAPIEIDDQPRFSYRSLMSEEKILVSGTNFFTQADNFRNRLNKLMLTFENLMNIPTFTTGF